MLLLVAVVLVPLAALPFVPIPWAPTIDKATVAKISAWSDGLCACVNAKDPPSCANKVENSFNTFDWPQRSTLDEDGMSKLEAASGPGRHCLSEIAAAQ